MTPYFSEISSWFWNPDIWLPSNVTWVSFKEQKHIQGKYENSGEFAQFSDLWYPIPLSLIVMLVRLLVEHLVFKPLGLWLGIKGNRRSRLQRNEVLEQLYCNTSKPNHEEVEIVVKRTSLSYQQVQSWLRQRRLLDQPNTLQKFCETGWRFTFYTGALLYGAHCLRHKSWFWAIEHCWIEYPNHKVDTDIWIYYMLELSFYWSLSISQFFDVKRKDFWGMFIHHNATIALMMFSWTTHFIRIGTLVLIVHDCADPLLELAKLFRYAKYKKTCDAIFFLFSITWVVTRCGVFPVWILYSTLFDAVKFFDMFPAYYIFNGLLCTLQLLHIVWTYLLYKVIQKALSKGNIDDMRSDGESEDSSEEDEKLNKKSR